MRTRRDCRLCGSDRLEPVLSLGETPLANEFVTEAERGLPQDRFPLDVHLCLSCGHAQLLDIVDPERLFRHYVYVSSTSPVFVDHFRRYAEEMLKLSGMPRGSTVVEIGSNDGALLRCFQQAGMRVLGVDPARAIAEAATQSGIQTRPEFFDLALAKQLKAEGWSASLIAANNVFAHADDLHGIAEGVAHLLEPDGLFVFEVSYLADVVEQTLFDTIYHEHLSYHAVTPLLAFFQRHGLELVDAVRVDPHGGSLRGIAKRRGGRWPRQARVQEMVALEQARGLDRPEGFRRFLNQIGQRKEELMTLLRTLKRQRQRLAGFGAPAKATTLMFHFGLGPDLLEYIIDDSPWKQGLYSPGHHLPVGPSAWLYDPARRPDAAVILAWNFAEPIIRTHQPFMDAGGRFIVPLPTVAVRP